MQSKPQQLTTEELLTADPVTLTAEQIDQRVRIAGLRKAERELEIVEAQNTEFQEKKIDAKRRADAKTLIIDEENQRKAREQGACRHKTGGKGLAGFYAGDGKQGYSVAIQKLPTSEVYFLCFRCQKEWHMPKKRDVLDGKITLAQYRAQEAEYAMVASWDRQLFDTDTGDIPGSCQFYIPRLEQQRQQDEIDFAAYLQQHRGEARA